MIRLRDRARAYPVTPELRWRHRFTFRIPLYTTETAIEEIQVESFASPRNPASRCSTTSGRNAHLR